MPYVMTNPVPTAFKEAGYSREAFHWLVWVELCGSDPDDRATGIYATDEWAGYCQRQADGTPPNDDTLSTDELFY